MDDLADASGISRRTIARYEMGEHVRPDMLSTMREAFEARGVRFLMNGPHKGAVVPPTPKPIEDESGRNPLLPRSA
jgi:transcriptional regulator with XRE-family HTH domain